MENFNITFKKTRDPFDNSYCYEFGGLEELKQFDCYTCNPLEEVNYYLAQIREIKKIILNDIRKITNYYLCDLSGDNSLVENLKILLDTYDNGVDFVDTMYYDQDITNFIILTDSYLCFNNIENDVDDDDFQLAYGDIDIYESIVLIDRAFKNYHFINMDTNLLTGKTKTNIESFNRSDSAITSTKTRYRGRFLLHDYSKNAPQKIRKRIANNQRNAIKKGVI